MREVILGPQPSREQSSTRARVSPPPWTWHRWANRQSSWRAVDLSLRKRYARQKIDKGQRSEERRAARCRDGGFFLCSKDPLRRRDGRSFKNCLRSLALAGSLGDLLGPLGADKEVSCDLADKLVSNNVALPCLCLCGILKRREVPWYV